MTRQRRLALWLAALAVALTVTAAASAKLSSAAHGVRASVAQAAPADDDAPVLPSRIAAAIRRTQNALDKAEENVDGAEYAKAIISLRAVRQNLVRADKAARRQMNAVADPEAETTPGPDSVIAALTLAQQAIVTVAGLFNGQSGTLVTGLTSTLVTAQNTRDKLLNAIIALDPEGAGADYADGMADTVDGYTDEVANIKEALADDTLSAGGKTALTAALARSNATLTKINNAFGGGE